MNSTDEPPTDQDGEPWYQHGLAFACTQCGNCCTGGPGAVYVDIDELHAIADYTGKSIGEVRLLHARPLRGRVSLTEFANGDCTFLDPATRHCRIYPARPKQCRTWPFWNSNLESAETWSAAKSGCPGIGRGEFVPLSEIERQRRIVDI